MFTRRIFIALFLSLCTLPVYAADEEAPYIEGVEYYAIAEPIKTLAKAGTVEVLEFFWYGCPHCFRLEPDMEEWLKKQPAGAVQLRRIPAVLGEMWSAGAQAFYTAEALGVLERIHKPLFDAIHLKNRTDLVRSSDALEAFFADFGVKPEAFRKTWNSFSVNSKVRRAIRLANQAGVSGVPSIVVNGRYWTNTSNAGGSHADLFRVVEYLAAKTAQN